MEVNLISTGKSHFVNICRFLLAKRTMYGRKVSCGNTYTCRWCRRLFSWNSWFCLLMPMRMPMPMTMTLRIAVWLCLFVSLLLKPTEKNTPTILLHYKPHNHVQLLDEENTAHFPIMAKSIEFDTTLTSAVQFSENWWWLIKVTLVLSFQYAKYYALGSSLLMIYFKIN